jgi:flagellar biosynthesis protein FliQ
MKTVSMQRTCTATLITRERSESMKLSCFIRSAVLTAGLLTGLLFAVLQAIFVAAR